MQSLSKAKLKFFSALLHKKYRNLSHLFIVEGIKLTNEAIASGFGIEAIIFLDKSYPQVSAKISTLNLSSELFLANEIDFYKLSEQVQSEGVLAIVQYPKNWKDVVTPSFSRPSIWLENIQDPGNLGTILRIADTFAIEQIICSENTVDALNPKVIRASMGAIFRLNLFYSPLFYDWIAHNAKEIWVADMQGTPLPNIKFTSTNSILMGNEANGISDKIKEIKGLQYVNIPQKGKAESLNVAIACGILAYTMSNYQ